MCLCVGMDMLVQVPTQRLAVSDSPATLPPRTAGAT